MVKQTDNVGQEQHTGRKRHCRSNSSSKQEKSTFSSYLYPVDGVLLRSNMGLWAVLDAPYRGDDLPQQVPHRVLLSAAELYGRHWHSEVGPGPLPPPLDCAVQPGDGTGNEPDLLDALTAPHHAGPGAWGRRQSTHMLHMDRNVLATKASH